MAILVVEIRQNPQPTSGWTCQLDWYGHVTLYSEDYQRVL